MGPCAQIAYTLAPKTTLRPKYMLFVLFGYMDPSGLFRLRVFGFRVSSLGFRVSGSRFGVCGV